MSKELGVTKKFLLTEIRHIPLEKMGKPYHFPLLCDAAG